MPASKAIAKGLAKKFTGIAVEDLLNAGDGDNFGPAASHASTEALEAGLDELFKRALDEHGARAAAIGEFKSCVGEVVEILRTSGNAELPVFVLIDEVDRCRPTYAITLLEEIKHIFGMPKICFVLSTNLSQLQQAVRAVYGPGFDGRRYLKRFFDREYTLPRPDNDSFTAQLLTDSPALSERKIDSGLPSTDEADAQRAIALLASAMNLDLRSQKQVFSMTASVASAVPVDRAVFLLWLYFLCGLQHRNPDLIEELDRGVDAPRFVALCSEIFTKDPGISYVHRGDHFGRDTSTKIVKLSDVLRKYYEWSRSDLIELRDKRSDGGRLSYPAANLERLLGEAPNPWSPSKRYPPSIARYMEWTRYLGSDERTTD